MTVADRKNSNRRRTASCWADRVVKIQFQGNVCSLKIVFPNWNQYWSFTWVSPTLKSTNASVPGLKPHLLGLRKERYIFFSCSSELHSNCTIGKCSLSHCIMFWWAIDSFLPGISRPSLTKAASEILNQCFWSCHHRHSSYRIFLTFN